MSNNGGGTAPTMPESHKVTQNAKPLGPSELVLAASLARRYYLDQHSKIEIAQEFGISRFKVSRLLAAAMTQGIVHIDIKLPSEIDAQLSAALKARYGLHHAFVVNVQPEDPTGPEPATDQLGPVAAHLITELVEDGDVLGLAWGRAVTATVVALTSLAPCTVVQLCGVHPLGPMNIGSVEAVRRAADLSGGHAFPIYAPALLPDPTTARTLRDQPGISDALAQFPQITKAVVAIGAWGPTLSTVYDSLNEAERDKYRDLGACGETLIHLVNADGDIIGTDLDDRAIAISAEKLRRIPEVIGVAGGIYKADAIKSVLKSGLLTSIVTDSSVARRLLEDSARPIG